jgi:hypothetical protein
VILDSQGEEDNKDDDLTRQADRKTMKLVKIDPEMVLKSITEGGKERTQ